MAGAAESNRNGSDSYRPGCSKHPTCTSRCYPQATTARSTLNGDRAVVHFHFPSYPPLCVASRRYLQHCWSFDRFSACQMMSSTSRLSPFYTGVAPCRGPSCCEEFIVPANLLNVVLKNLLHNLPFDNELKPDAVEDPGPTKGSITPSPTAAGELTTPVARLTGSNQHCWPSAAVLRRIP